VQQRPLFFPVRLYGRRIVQLQLERVTLVVPAVEEQQYHIMHNGGDVTVPYFSSLSVYLGVSAVYMAR
jgi:hypothetical protein